MFDEWRRARHDDGAAIAPLDALTFLYFALARSTAAIASPGRRQSRRGHVLRRQMARCEHGARADVFAHSFLKDGGTLLA